MPGVMYDQAKQDNFMKLYMARFFHLDTEDVAYASVSTSWWHRPSSLTKPQSSGC